MFFLKDLSSYTLLFIINIIIFSSSSSSSSSSSISIIISIIIINPFSHLQLLNAVTYEALLVHYRIL